MSFSVDYANTNESVGDNDDIVTGRDNVSRIGGQRAPKTWVAVCPPFGKWKRS